MRAHMCMSLSVHCTDSSIDDLAVRERANLFHVDQMHG